MKPECKLHWTGLNWRRSVAGKLTGPGRETLDQAIHDAHEAGFIILSVHTTTGAAKEERAEMAEGTEAT